MTPRRAPSCSAGRSTSPRTWARSSTSSPTRPAPSPRTGWSSGAASCRAWSTLTTPTVSLRGGGQGLRCGQDAPPRPPQRRPRWTGGGQHRASARSRSSGDSVGRVGGCIRFVRFIKPRTKTTASALDRRLRAVPLAVRRGCRRNEHAVMVSPPTLAVSSCNASARGRKPCSYEL